MVIYKFGNGDIKNDSYEISYKKPFAYCKKQGKEKVKNKPAQKFKKEILRKEFCIINSKKPEERMGRRWKKVNLLCW